MIVIKDPSAFVRANTRLQRPSHTPEIALHLADEITPLWQLTEESLGEIGLDPPFWAFAWSGGQGLARYILDHPETVAGKRVLDFATGSGLVAIAAMQAGAAEATGCDIDRLCGGAVSVNAEANGVAVGFIHADLLEGPPPEVDVITAGDIAYEKPLAARVRAWLSEARARGTEVLIGDPHRTYFDPTGLEHLAEYRVETTRELEDFAVKRSGVWRMV